MIFQKEHFELLAPGGDLDSIKAAIVAGADAVYCGLDRFNARNRATNITLDVLDSVIELAHQNNCKLFLTLNIVVLESEVPSIIRLLKQLADSAIDGVIVQDLGLAYVIKHHFPTLDMHASTQMNTHNEGQILLLNHLGASRVNLSRELNIDEITHLAQFGHKHGVMMEVFVHGSYCIGFSGVCYFSSEMRGASGNRGRCSQPCRDQYRMTSAGNQYPLNLKDNSAYLDIEALANAGVYSLKIEGRIKKSHYVYTTVDSWRKQIDHFCQTGETLNDTTDLYTVFNRDFTNGYLKGDIHRDMYIDNPRNFAATHFAKLSSDEGDEALKAAKNFVYDRTTHIMNKVDSLIQAMHVETNSRRGLKGGGTLIDIPLPKYDVNANLSRSPKLSVLIADSNDLHLVEEIRDVQFFYQIPDALELQLNEVLENFSRYPNLQPYFPAVMIGEHYQAAYQLLEQVKPATLITNNLGIAHIAQALGLNWVAGPQLNITNSLSLKCIQQDLAGSGAFVSNELSAKQMNRLVNPQGFKLFYSVYHPIHLLTSRQCLLIQAAGCRKQRMNKGCMKRCEKTASIISLKDHAYVIHKQRGSYNRLYGEHNFLNLDVLSDVPNLYTDVMIDLTDIPTQTDVSMTKPELIALFKKSIEATGDMEIPVENVVLGTTNKQYKKGL